MGFKLVVVLEALVNVVPGREVLHTTVHGSLEGWARDHGGAATILNLFVDLFEPQRNDIRILVANEAELATDLAHMVSAEESVFTSEAKLQIFGHLGHAPGLVQLRDRVIAVYARSVAALLQHLFQVLERLSEHFSIETANRERVVLRQDVLHGRLLVDEGHSHVLVCSFLFPVEALLVIFELGHFIDENLVALVL